MSFIFTNVYHCLARGWLTTANKLGIHDSQGLSHTISNELYTKILSMTFQIHICFITLWLWLKRGSNKINTKCLLMHWLQKMPPTTCSYLRHENTASAGYWADFDKLKTKQEFKRCSDHHLGGQVIFACPNWSHLIMEHTYAVLCALEHKLFPFSINYSLTN